MARPTIKERILAYLLTHPDGVTDREFTEALLLPNPVQANLRCRQLERAGLIERRRVHNRILNFPAAVLEPRPMSDSSERDGEAISASSEPAERPWFWEGNVQARVVGYLREQGYTIVRTADTATHEAGRDIEAGKDGTRLWITVKGYPKGTERTRATTQARHWFKEALFDIVAWRGEDTLARLAIALPDYPRYRALAEKVHWLEPVVPFAYIWVRKDGSVEADSGLV